MADKEEMIGIELFEKRKDGFYRAGGTSITRQEAIEKMSKAIFYKTGFPKHCLWEIVNEETRTVYRLYAREALNALLGVEK